MTTCRCLSRSCKSICLRATSTSRLFVPGCAWVCGDWRVSVSCANMLIISDKRKPPKHARNGRCALGGGATGLRVLGMSGILTGQLHARATADSPPKLLALSSQIARAHACSCACVRVCVRACVRSHVNTSSLISACQSAKLRHVLKCTARSRSVPLSCSDLASRRGSRRSSGTSNLELFSIWCSYVEGKPEHERRQEFQQINERCVLSYTHTSSCWLQCYTYIAMLSLELRPNFLQLLDIFHYNVLFVIQHLFLCS